MRKVKESKSQSSKTNPEKSLEAQNMRESSLEIVQKNKLAIEEPNLNDPKTKLQRSKIKLQKGWKVSRNESEN